MPFKNIFLIGFMGSGKSTLGRELATLINWPFIDMDEELEKKFKEPAAKIFEKQGEAFFRSEETKLLKNLSRLSRPAVIATGGGLVEAEANRSILKNGFCLFLDSSLRSIHKRLSGQEKTRRPLAANKSRSELESLYLRRLPLYQECAKETFFASKSKFNALGVIKKVFPTGHNNINSHRQFSSIDIMWEGLSTALINKLKKSGGLILLDQALSHEEGEWRKRLPNFSLIQARKKGEGAKTINAALDIFKAMERAGLSRDSWLLVRGGGSLTDLGGFCAGLYRRGLRLFYMPTTLLCAADAAIGGKTAINFEGAKNQLGHFYLPEHVIIQPSVFLGLPPKMITDGLVEIYKMGLLSDPALAETISRHKERLLAKDLSLIVEVLEKAIYAKTQVVNLDFREERGIRDVLNLGHTFGHVMESYYAPHMSHGQAVAYGLAVMARLSHNLGFLSPESMAEIIKTVKGLSDNWPAPPPEGDIERLIMKDKKIRQGALKFVILKKYGEPHVASVNSGMVIEAARQLAAGDK